MLCADISHKILCTDMVLSRWSLSKLAQFPQQEDVLTTSTGKRTHEACSPPPMERSLLWSIIARHMVLKFMTKNSHCWWTSQRKVRSEWEELQGHPAHSRAVGWVIGHATIWLARSNNFASRKAPESSLVLSDGFSIGFPAGLETKVCQTGLG